MTVKQLSVFLENKSGSLESVLGCFKKSGVQLIATTIADTTEYGIFRIICDDPEKAYDALKQTGVAVSLSEVFCIELDDKPGRAAETISRFAHEGLNISYLYSFVWKGKGVLIFKTDDPQKAAGIIEKGDF